MTAPDLEIKANGLKSIFTPPSQWGNRRDDIQWNRENIRFSRRTLIPQANRLIFIHIIFRKTVRPRLTHSSIFCLSKLYITRN